jgi:Kef-type K+ transport system membrane component KefB
VTLATDDLAHILLALALLVAVAHGLGYVFARFRQPAVIGEILGGLLLGPTLFGELFPDAQASVFPDNGATAVALGTVYQLGLLLLMFSAGAQMRSLFHRDEGKLVAAISVTGTVLPFIAGLAAFQLLDTDPLMGPASDELALLLVFAIAVAVTSIPVISRIMFDLDILDTAFARIVLTVAVVEDLLLYVVLSIALGQVDEQQNEFGLPAALNIEPGTATAFAYHAVVTVAFLGVLLAVGRRVFAWSLKVRYNVLKRRNPIGFQLVVMFALAVACVALGIVPLFGAFVAGMVVAAGSGDGANRAREAITGFSFAFFVPVYFAIVGLRLDLVRDLDVLFFVGFLAFACVAKTLSVYAGARLARDPRGSAMNLAITMNARGGPGIVVASVAFDAGIISESLFTTLVLLAIVTSLAAGAWLERLVASGRPLREEPLPPAAPPAAAEPVMGHQSSSR